MVIEGTYITHYGYYVPLNKITSEQHEMIMKDLIVFPISKDMSHQEIEASKFSLFRYTKGKDYVIVPRYYGISKFGKTNQIYFGDNNISVNFTKKLRPKQEIVVEKCYNYMLKAGGGLLSVPCGFGKCLGKGTEIIMYNGDIKKIEDIVVGDIVMGDNSEPKEVISLGRGKSIMFKVTDSSTGLEYVVNDSHILSLKNDGDEFTFNNFEYKNGDIIDIPIRDYLRLIKNYNIELKGFRVPIEFNRNEPCEDAFIFGKKFRGNLTYENSRKYIVNDKETRKNFLEGILSSRNITNNSNIYVDIDNFSHVEFKMIIFLIGSLGLSWKRINDQIIIGVGNDQSYHINIVSIGTDSYYGFELQDNGRFLLSDLTVTHNTVCSLKIGEMLGLKMLVIVHKTDFVEQWTEKIIEFWGISPERIGVIKRDKCEIEGKDIVIAMVQTLVLRDYYSEVFNKFGFVVYDEAHHMPCRTYTNVLMRTGARFTMALTATPYRYDGLIKIMYWYCGGTMYSEKLKINKNVVVKKIIFRSKDTKRFRLKERWFKGKKRPDTVSIESNLCEIEKRNYHLVKILYHLVKFYPDRKILVLSRRKTHLKILKKMLKNMIRDDIDKGILDENENTICTYTGTTKKKKKIFAIECGDVLFATYDMAQEGLDIKRMNTILLASPKKNIVQSIGRIMRLILGPGDLKPLIIDFCDDMELMRNWGEKREQIYRICKYEISYYYIDDSIYVGHNEYNGCDESIIDEYDKIMKEMAMCNKEYGKIIDECKDYFPPGKMIGVSNTDYNDIMISSMLDIKRLSPEDVETEIIDEGRTDIDFDKDFESGEKIRISDGNVSISAFEDNKNKNTVVYRKSLFK
jgi:superfamily II DNA or RNA helicase